MKKLFNKKIVCGILAAAILTSVPAYAAVDIEQFYSFSDYQGGMPEGFTPGLNDNKQPVASTLTSGWDDAEGGNFFKVNASATTPWAIKFDEEVVDGILQIGFDFKIDDPKQTDYAEGTVGKNETLASRQILAPTLFNTSQKSSVYSTNDSQLELDKKDNTLLLNGFDSSTMNLMKFELSSSNFGNEAGKWVSGYTQTVLYSRGRNDNTDVDTARYVYNEASNIVDFDGWNRADIFVNMSDATMDIYINGIKMKGSDANAVERYINWNQHLPWDEEAYGKLPKTGEFGLKTDFATGFKAFGMGYIGYITNTSFDNMYIRNYNEGEAEVVIAADQSMTGDDTNVYLSFSEYLDAVPTADDFIFTDFGGTVVNPISVVRANAHQIVLEMPAGAARYDVAFNKSSSSLKGVSGAPLSDRKAVAYVKEAVGGVMKPILNTMEIQDINGKKMDIASLEGISAGAAKAIFKFTSPIGNVDNTKVYIQKVGGEKLNADYELSDNNRTVTMNFLELLESAEEGQAPVQYQVVISDTLTADDGVTPIAGTYVWNFEVQPGGAYGFSGKVTAFTSRNAQATLNIVKADNLERKGTVMFCSYVEDSDGFKKLEKVKLVPYQFAADTKKIETTII